MKLRILILLSIFLLVPTIFTNAAMIDKLNGRILLQVESKGQAWYVSPKDGTRYYMANGNEAFQIMKKLGVGISNKDLDRVKVDSSFRKKFIGKILLQVQDKGQAYYISFDGKYHYLKDGTSAYGIMRKLGLGISNKDLEKIKVYGDSKTTLKSDLGVNQDGQNKESQNVSEQFNFDMIAKINSIDFDCTPFKSDWLKEVCYSKIFSLALRSGAAPSTIKSLPIEISKGEKLRAIGETLDSYAQAINNQNSGLFLEVFSIDFYKQNTGGNVIDVKGAQKILEAYKKNIKNKEIKFVIIPENSKEENRGFFKVAFHILLDGVLYEENGESTVYSYMIGGNKSWKKYDIDFDEALK